MCLTHQQSTMNRVTSLNSSIPGAESVSTEPAKLAFQNTAIKRKHPSMRTRGIIVLYNANACAARSWCTACTGRWWTMPHTAQTSYRETSMCQPLKKVVKDCRFRSGKDMKAMVVQWFQHESRVFIDGMCRHSTPVGIRSERFLDGFHLNKPH